MPVFAEDICHHIPQELHPIEKATRAQNLVKTRSHSLIYLSCISFALPTNKKNEQGVSCNHRLSFTLLDLESTPVNLRRNKVLFPKAILVSVSDSNYHPLRKLFLENLHSSLVCSSLKVLIAIVAFVKGIVMLRPDNAYR